MAGSYGVQRMISRSMCSTGRNWSYLSRPAYLDRGKTISGLWRSAGLQQGKARFSGSPIFNKTQAAEAADDLNKPIRFTTSKAAKFTAAESLSGDANPDSPDWQPYVVIISVGSFLIYFLYLREENDVDLELEKPLWQKVPNLERQQLHLVLDYNRAHDLETADIEKRLEEVYKEEAVKKAKAVAAAEKEEAAKKAIPATAEIEKNRK